MSTFPTSRFWRRTDLSGHDHALIDDRSGLRAQGVALAPAPVPYTCRYELTTDPDWAVVRLEVTAEGAGWQRRVRLERRDGEWRVPTSEQGDLAGALRAAGQRGAELPGVEEPDRLADAVDVDLAGAPLFNTLPVRRLGLLSAPAGTEHRLTVAWVLLPSLAVALVDQVYTALGDRRVRYASGGFTADLELDERGFVERYPGLAERL